MEVELVVVVVDVVVVVLLMLRMRARIVLGRAGLAPDRVASSANATATATNILIKRILIIRIY